MGLFSTNIENNYHDTFITKSPDTINVHEHKAPTDASVKLLIELEEKARLKIVSSILIEDNIFNGTAVMYQIASPSMMTEFKYYLKFMLNGKEYKCSYDMTEPKFRLVMSNIISSGNHDNYTYFLKVRLIEEFSKLISIEMIKNLDIK